MLFSLRSVARLPFATARSEHRQPAYNLGGDSQQLLTMGCREDVGWVILWVVHISGAATLGEDHVEEHRSILLLDSL